MVCGCSMLLLWHIRQAISRYPESSQWPCYSRHEAGDTTWSALALRMTVLQNASLYHVYTKGSKGITCLSYFTSQTRLSLRRSEKSVHRFTRNHFLWSTLINHLSHLSSKQPAAKRPLPSSRHPVACTFPRFTCLRHQRPARELLLPMQQVGVVAETWSAFSHAKVGTINGVSLMFFQVLYIPKGIRKHIPPLKSPLLDSSPTTAWYQTFLAWLASKSATPRVPATLMLPLAPVLEIHGDPIGSHLQPSVPSFGCVQTGEGIPPFLLDV